MSAVHGPWAVFAERRDPGGSQAPDQTRTPEGVEWVGWIAAGVAVCALAWWSESLTLPPLGVLAGATAVWTIVARRCAGSTGIAAALVLWFGLGSAVGVQARLDEIGSSWPAVRQRVEERAASSLGQELDRLVDEGVATTDSLARIVPPQSRRPPERVLFADLAEMRRASGASAVAVYGADGYPLAWAGQHRGPVPTPVRLGGRDYFFAPGPLFSYLYFVRDLGGGRTGMVAFLLSGTPGAREDRLPFAEGFAAEHGITPRFSLPDRAQGAAVWDWVTADGRLLSVTWGALTQEAWREHLLGRGRLLAGGADLLALTLLVLGWCRRSVGPVAVPVAVTAAVLLLSPLQAWGLPQELFSPLDFVLPLPGIDLGLGALLILLGALVLWLLGRDPPPPARSWAAWGVRVAAVGVLLAVWFAVLRDAASTNLLTSGPAGSAFLVAAAVLGFSAVLLGLHRRAPVGASHDRERLGAAGAAGVAALLAAALVVWWRPESTLPAWTPALWVIPFALFALAPPSSGLRRAHLATWLLLGWIAGTAASSHLWVLHTEARLDAAEQELASLGTEPDPFLDFMLRQFSEQVLRSAADGESGVNLLFRSWVASGIAAEGYEAQVTLWEGDRPAAELRLTDAPVDSSRISGLLPAARSAEEPIIQRDSSDAAANYRLLVPLPDGRVVSVAVPPRLSLGRSTALARFFASGADARLGEGATLSLAGAIREPPGVSGRISDWVRTSSGWLSEVRIPYGAGAVHAHLIVRTPAGAILGARGILFLAILLAGLTTIWIAARGLGGEGPPLKRGQLWLRSFRGRVTLALFAFFLIPLLVMSATAYRALTREAVRTAFALAERAVDQAAAEAGTRPLAAVAAQVRSDLLLYRSGVLAAAAAPEVLELGLYPAWLPPSVYLAFRSAEATTASTETRLGPHRYLIAYRRLAGDQVLASPTALASGEIARRRAELADVVAVFLILGAALSWILSVLVGRALARPIVTLSGAAASVGAGDLGVRLEEQRQDEFGELFRSFNRMIRRLRRGRSALLRETRRTDAILAEVGTGIIALDSGGRVRLINARASELLGVRVERGRPLSPDGGLSSALVSAIEAFRGSQAEETGREIDADGRVVRLRLRRLGADGGRETGTVAALEDITAEIRSARVLAWGEMARQVAHEIKNPLTPIKLSVQHLRRAHGDRHPDFGAILDRNVDSILAEIDRLGEIARAFARFGTPPPAPGELEPVDIGAVVAETLALYRGGDDITAYRSENEVGDVRVLARSGELKEVLVNLLENARAAMTAGGEVRVSLHPDGSASVDLEVADTGEGIPAEALGRIWDPHFSTRSSGTGLGLAIVRRLVEGWGGRVDAESRPGEGTTVRVRLRVAR